MKKLFARGVVFFTPVFAFIAFGVWVLFRTGEVRAVDVEQLAHDQQSSSTELLFGPAYSDCTSYLKIATTALVRPKVLVTGTSRSVQVRAAFFSVPFYNAGNAIARAPELRPFLARVPKEAQPEVFLLILDQFFLNAATNAADAIEFPPFEERATCTPKGKFVTENWYRAYRDILRRKITPGLLQSPPFADGVGLRAQAYGAGYRSDGSYSIGTDGVVAFDDTYNRMAKGVRRFQWGSDVSPELVNEVAAFLDEASKRGIHVVAVMPPYAPTVYDRLLASDHFGYVPKVYPALANVFESRGHSLYDFSDVRNLGMTDADFYDGFHGSEKLFARLMLEVSKTDPKMAAAVDAPRIQQMLTAPVDRLHLVPVASAGKTRQ